MSRILVVDDNDQNLYLARFLLEQKGHETEEAHNGQEAVEMAANSNFDAIIMDVQMPVMNGLEATRQIKERGGASPIVALTAQAMPGDKEKILAAGCDGYIKKPIEPESFATEIEGFIS